MEHVLDNPAWNALISGNRTLSNGTERVKYFHPEVSPFVAMREQSMENFRLLYEAVPHNSPVLFVSIAETEFPVEWTVLRVIKGRQMVFDQKAQVGDVTVKMRPLTQSDVPKMIELTKITDPGPFGPRTIEFGHYQGIFDGEQLVSMAGQRLHAFEYAEISAVCTEPTYLGKGYARQLLGWQIHRMLSVGNLPYLHVRSDNDRAIGLYESLGFWTRREVVFYVLKKSN
jgi:GNAT superfamily N-acetyltransferase